MNNSFIINFSSRILLCVLLCFVLNIGIGQNTNNPFEIKNRIIEQADSINYKVTFPSDTINDKIFPTQSIENVKSKSESVVELTNGENPFEVNHVPLRKKDIVQRKSSAEKQQTNDTPPSKGFIYWLLIGTLIVLTLASTTNRKLLSNVTKSIFNENILKLEHRSKNSLNLEYLLLYLIFFINAGIFLMLIWHHYYDGEVRFSNFIKCFGLVTAVYLIRHITLFLFGNIFPVQKESSLYNFTIQVFNAFIGIVLIPINLFLAFGSDKIAQTTLMVGLILIGILFIIRYIRGAVISISFIFNNLILFFIYLCTLEIAPILMLFKVLGKY